MGWRGTRVWAGEAHEYGLARYAGTAPSRRRLGGGTRERRHGSGRQPTPACFGQSLEHKRALFAAINHLPRNKQGESLCPLATKGHNCISPSGAIPSRSRECANTTQCDVTGWASRSLSQVWLKHIQKVIFQITAIMKLLSNHSLDQTLVNIFRNKITN